MKRPMYDRPAAYNGTRTEGPLWDDYQAHLKNFNKEWAEYERQGPTESIEEFRHRQILDAIRDRR